MKLEPIPKNRNNTAKIHNLPIKDVKHIAGSTRYGLELLKEIGQSIVVFWTDRGKLYSTTNQYSKKHPDTSFVYDKIETGYRVWRIK